MAIKSHRHLYSKRIFDLIQDIKGVLNFFSTNFIEN